jgi:hypothetical protein
MAADRKNEGTPMMTCRELDQLVTPFIDDECSATERTEVLAHLQQCHGCRIRVEAESTARHVLSGHAAVARTLGVTPPWRPRVFRLGQPTLPVHLTVLLLCGMIGAGLLVFWLRPTPVLAVGVIGDSVCQREHLFTARFNVGDHECTLGCVKAGAEFVLVTDTQVYRLGRDLPDAATLGSQRVAIEGTLDGDLIRISKVTPVDAAAGKP